MIKIIALVNPSIIFLLYFWIACLANNIYSMYYGYYGKSFVKNLLLYQIQAIVYTIIIFIFTLFNTNFKGDSILDKQFSFLAYEEVFIKVFYIIALFLLVYIIYISFYLMKKDTIFLSFNQEDAKIELFNALIKRHIFSILYFLFAYFPSTLYMIIKFFLSINISKGLYVSYYSMLLVSFNGMYLFIVKTFDPAMREFLREYIFNELFICCIKRKYPDDITNLTYDLVVQSSIEESFIQDDKRNSSLIEVDKDMTDKNQKYIELSIINKNYGKFISSLNSKPSPENYIQKNDIIPEAQDKSDGNLSINKLKSEKVSEDMTSSQKSLPIMEKKNFLRNHVLLLENDDLYANSLNENKMQFNILNKKSNRKISFQQGRSVSKITRNVLKEGTLFDIIKERMDLDDNLIRMLAISVSLIECRIYENNYYQEKYFNSPLPWEEKKFYKEKSIWKTYNQQSLPDELSAKKDEKFRKVTFGVRAFCPFVFHHLRSIDHISIYEILQSLDPIKNLSMINELKITGGRSSNATSTTWDKKIIIKTISKEEKRIFKHKMIKGYHKRMRDTKSILSRIYGLYKIRIGNKKKTHVLVQKNMCELPIETNLLTFDLKGSTVDRQSISMNDCKTLNKEKIMEKYKKKVLKDKDLKILQMEFNLNKKNAQNLNEILDNDSAFLENFLVTDYSLLVFVHKYVKEDMKKNFGNLRIMESIDCTYIFNFSIIDFLGTFNFERKGEKFAKELVSILKQAKDHNFSVLEPIPYANRFRKFMKSIITIN